MDRQAELLSVIERKDPSQVVNDLDLETLFVRLLDDMDLGNLPTTMARLRKNCGLSLENIQMLSVSLNEAAGKLALPVSIVRKSPNISPHKQDSLYRLIRYQIKTDPAGPRALIPVHPRDSRAFEYYSSMLRICHQIILGLSDENKLHRFQALMAVRWMKGESLPSIIDAQIKRSKSVKTRKVIRDTLDTIERDIRFQVVRLCSCYNAILTHALHDLGFPDLTSSILPVPLFLELGASDRTMISFMSQGLSRPTAAALNDIAANKNMDMAQALSWLKTRPLENYGLSPLLLKEVARVTLGATN